MRNKMKRFLSILLSLVMVITLLPTMSMTVDAATYNSFIFDDLQPNDILKPGTMKQMENDINIVLQSGSWCTYDAEESAYIPGTEEKTYGIDSGQTFVVSEYSEFPGAIFDTDRNMYLPYVNGEKVDAWKVVSVGEGAITLAGYDGITKYPLWVGGIRVTSANADNIDGQSKASYDVTTNTLTLDNYIYEGAGYKFNNSYAGIYYRPNDYEQNLTINLKGTNSVTCRPPYEEEVVLTSINGIYVDNYSDLTIKGDGTLTSIIDIRYVEDVDQTYSIRVSGNLFIEKEAKVVANVSQSNSQENVGVYTKGGKITVNGTLEIKGKQEIGVCMAAGNGQMTVTGTLIASGADRAFSIHFNESFQYTVPEGYTVTESGNVDGTDATPVSVGNNTSASAKYVKIMPTPKEPVSYMAWNGTTLVEKTGDDACTDYTVVTADTTTFEDGKWYVVSNSVTVSSRITVTGTVNLILCDGATLTANAGITVASGDTLNIYAQSEGEGTGTLTATGNTQAAGIGGISEGNGGTVNIHGGTVNAIGGNCANSADSAFDSGAGIGGGKSGNGGTVTIYGGTVNATSGNGNSAGIGGGGPNDGGGSSGGSGGSVTIHGGIVTATGNYRGAGIGGGMYGNGGTVTIYGGTVKAYGGSFSGAGIGGGMYGNGGTVTINGGSVYAVGGGEAMGIGCKFPMFPDDPMPSDPAPGVLSLDAGVKLETSGDGNNWTDTTSTPDTRTKYMRTTYVASSHTHNFTYSASDATITATCSADDCTLTTNPTLTIVAPTMTAYGQTGDGISAEATLDNLEAFNRETGKTIATADIKYVGRDGTTYQESATAPIDAGKYTAKITTKDENEVEITAKVDYEIAKAEPKAGDFTFTAPSGLTYDGNQKSATVVPKDGITGMGDVTVKYYSDSECKSTVNPTNAGTYYVGIELAEGTNYKATSNDLHDEAWWFEIAKATPSKDDFTFGAPSELTYDGNQKTATVVPNEGVTGMGNVAVQYYSDAEGTEEVELPTNAGTYYVGITVAEGDNYTATTSVVHDSSWKFTVGRATPTVDDFTFNEPENLSYDGTDKTATVVPKSGVIGMGNVTVKYYSDAACTTEAEPENVDTYYVGITVAEGDNYNATTAVLHGENWKFTISKADAVAATITANDLTYDGTDQALVNVTGEAEGGEMQYALGENATTAPANNLYSTSIPTGTDPGTYYVWYKVVADSNHNDTDPVCVQNIEIAKIKAELNWSDLTLKYTGQPQLPTATVKNKAKDDEVTVVLTGAATDAGFYEATFVKLEGKDAGNYNLPDEDLSRYYNIVKGTHQISVSIEDWTYGDEPKIPVVTGEPDGRKATVEYKSQEDNTYVSDVPVDAGKYTVRATLEGDNNYETASAEYNFTVYPKEVILTWGDTEFTYNGKDQIPEVTVSGLVGEDSVEAVVIGDATAVGTHTAMVMSLAGDGASNYKLPAAVKTTFTIAKADIPVDQGDNPAKLTMPGWIYGDDAADPVIENNIGGGTVNYSYAKYGIGMADPEDLVFESKKPSAAGLYIVKAEISATENYYGATLYAPFVITPRTAKLEWGDTSFVYDGKEHVPACEVANKVYGDKCLVTVSGSASTVGEHKATAIKLSNDNYVLPASGDQNFTISKDGLDLSVSMTGWVYGDEANAPLVEGNKGNADITYTYYTDEDLSAKTGTAEGAVAEGGIPSYAGTYFVQASAAATDGYEADVAVAEFTIEKRMPVIEWSDISLTYNAKAQKPVAEITNKVEGDELILTVYGEAVDAGDYEAVLTVSGAAADNYETPAITTQRFRINKLAAELAWGETRFVYNGSDQVPTVSVNNLIKGDEMALTVVGASTAVGEHTATVTKLSNANYALPEETSQVFYIEKADVATDEGQSENPAMFAMADWIYGETAPEPVLENNIGGGTVTFGYALLPEGTEPASYGELDYTTVKPKAAGVYVAKADIGATENYNSATLYDIFVIEPKTASLTWSDTSVIYDGEEHSPSCEVSNLEFSDECEVTVSGNAIAAGEHSAWAIALSNANYVLPTSTKTTFVISKGTPALTVNMAGWTYGDEAAAPVVEGNDGEGNVSYVYYRDEELTEKTGTGDGAAVNGDIPAYAGTYYVAATVEETDGYNSAVATAEFTIEKRQLTFTWTGFALTYDGKEHLPAAAPENVATGDELSVIISGTQKAAGEYEAVIEGIEGEGADNYALPEDLTQAFKIAKKTAELKWGSTEFIYTGKDQIPTVEVANLEDGDVCELTVTGAATAVGTHKATVISISNDNYELPAKLEKSFTIVKADLNEDAKVIINDWTYDENPSVPKVEGNIEGANVTYKYKKAGADDSSYTTTVPVNAGDYTVIAIIDTTAGYNEKPVTADFTIRKAESRIEKAPKAVAGLFYDATAQELVTKGEAFGGKVVYAAVSENQIEPEDGLYTEAVATGILSGTYYVWYKVAGDANHNDSDAAMTEAVIRPVTRENLIDYIGEVTGYHDEIKGEEDYADIAKDLKDAIDAAQVAADDDNVTDEQIGQAIKALSDAHNDAMDRVQDVIDTKAAKAVTDMIKALPAADKVEVYDEQAVRDAVSAFEKLTDPQVAKLDGADVKKLDDVLKSLEVVLEPYRKMAASNKNRDRLVALLNSRGFDTINGIYQTPYDTVSMNYTVAKGRITHVSFDVKNLKDGDNFLTMNTGTRMILTDKFTVVDNFANKRDYRKVAKSLKLKDYGYVLDVKKLKGRSTYEMILVSADGRKRLIIDVVDLALNKKGMRKAALTTPVKEAEVGAKAVSENKISDVGFAENGGVITITSAPVLKSEINPRKNRSARFISGVWMVGGTAITYGKTQTVTKGKVTVYAKVNSDGTLSIGKAEGSGKGSMPITYILNGKVIVKKNKTSMRSKTYRAKVKVK